MALFLSARAPREDGVHVVYGSECLGALGAGIPDLGRESFGSCWRRCVLNLPGSERRLFLILSKGTRSTTSSEEFYHEF